MFHVSYELWGIAVAVLLIDIAVFLIGIGALKLGVSHKSSACGCGSKRAKTNASGRDHASEHRALMVRMTRTTDSMLATLALTIEQERQKLGLDVRNPSMTEAIDAFQAEETQVSDNRHLPYNRILPMAHNGIAVPMIANQLQLPEAEVSMVMRLNAA